MLKKLTQQATDLIIQSIASGEVMGANLLITKGNEELVYAQAGMADREAEKPIERNTIFRLYSMTKPITAVAAMILMERGMLDLYEPVADILPAFAHQKVERDGKLYTPERPILMHDLLAMTSGLVYPEEQTMGGRAVTKVFEEACARLESDHSVSTQEMAEKNCGMSTGICTWDKLAVCRQTSSRQCSSGSDWKGIPMQILCGDVWHLNCSRESV